MELGRGRRAARAASRTFSAAGLAIAAALTLAACNPDNQPNVAAAQPRGATVAFESIDGPPQAQFRTLVQDLDSEAQARRLAVMARGQSSAYRVRGYLAATVNRGKTTISWVWDVFDRAEQRALRITGSETAKAGQGRGWQAADGAMMQRIAKSSMDELAAFLTSPAVAPGTPDTSGPQIAFAVPNVSTPEAAGIFRIFHPNADPVLGAGGSQRRRGPIRAAAAPPPGAGRRGFGQRNRDPGRRPALIRQSSFTLAAKAAGQGFGAVLPVPASLVMTTPPAEISNVRIFECRARTERSSSLPATRIPRWHRQSATISRPR